MKFEINMKNLISDNSQEFTIIRSASQSGHLDENGLWVDGSDSNTSIQTNFMVSTAKKSDYEYLKIGATTTQLIKIRQMKSETEKIQQNDTFVFNGLNFKIIKQKLYMSHILDFDVWYAVTEADAIENP